MPRPGSLSVTVRARGVERPSADQVRAAAVCMPERRPGFLKGAHRLRAVNDRAARSTLSPGTLPGFVADHADRHVFRVPHPEDLLARHTMIAEHARRLTESKHADLPRPPRPASRSRSTHRSRFGC